MEPIKRRKLSSEETRAVLAFDDELMAEAEAIKADIKRLAPGECMAFSPDDQCSADGLVFFLWMLLKQLRPDFAVLAQGKGDVYVYRS